jgi:hypothetical protein
MGSAPIAMGVRIENLTVDCNNKLDATGIQNVWSQEESGLRHVLMENCPASGLDVETSAAQNSGPYEDLEVLNYEKCTNCSAATVPIIAKEVAAFRGIRGATINSGRRNSDRLIRIFCGHSLRTCRFLPNHGLAESH